MSVTNIPIMQCSSFGSRVHNIRHYSVHVHKGEHLILGSCRRVIMLSRHTRSNGVNGKFSRNSPICNTYKVRQINRINQGLTQPTPPMPNSISHVYIFWSLSRFVVTQLQSERTLIPAESVPATADWALAIAEDKSGVVLILNQHTCLPKEKGKRTNWQLLSWELLPQH